jgi:hypothetical protein
MAELTSEQLKKVANWLNKAGIKPECTVCGKIAIPILQLVYIPDPTTSNLFDHGRPVHNTYLTWTCGNCFAMRWFRSEPILFSEDPSLWNGSMVPNPRA